MPIYFTMLILLCFSLPHYRVPYMYMYVALIIIINVDHAETAQFINPCNVDHTNTCSRVIDVE